MTNCKEKRIYVQDPSHILQLQNKTKQERQSHLYLPFIIYTANSKPIFQLASINS